MSTMPLHGYISLLLVEGLHLLNLVIAAHEDARLVVNVLRYNFEHALHLAVNRLATS
jgi:hypothetical protein